MSKSESFVKQAKPMQLIFVSDGKEALNIFLLGCMNTC